MDYRTDSFLRRFDAATTHLQARDVKDIVSLKYRQNVPDSDYLRFVDDLKRSSDLSIQSVNGSFGGRAWLASDDTQNRVILVEHETGLEILGAIGSAASLIALLPLISSAWTRLRHRFFGPPFDHPDVEGIEVRRVDQGGSLIEQQIPSIEVYVLNTALRDYSVLTQRVSQLEVEVRSLKTQGPDTAQKQTAASKRKKSKKK